MPIPTGQGVTLIELITVLAVIAIIAAYAIPSYERYQFRNDRTDAIAGLYIGVNDMERCAATQGGEFSDCSIDSLDPVAGTPGTFQSPKGSYNITLAIMDDGTLFSLTASRNGQADTECYDFVIDALGQRQNRTAEGTSMSMDTVQKCWQL